jgi:CDP-diacylglycerol--glycerol-3-phosphate 3-phosphatidyltransferase
VPFLVLLILAKTRVAAYAATAVFLVGAATDKLDGYLARRFAVSTRTGEWLDPLADKVLVAAPILTLSALGEFPAWAAVVILVREVGISVLRAYLGLQGVAMPASQGAKIKTSVQLFAIVLYLLPLGSWAHGLRLGVLIGAVVFTLVTGVQYLVAAGPAVRAARLAAHQAVPGARSIE